jgi:uncharacterized protein YjbI with pentapeptide repeats
MVKIKLHIKSITGEILFEFEKENNTIKETVQNFLLSKKGEIIKYADLSEMNLSGISFDNSRFYNSSFDNSRFDNSSFYNSRFYNSSFDNSSFYNSSFYNSRFYNSSFDNSSFYNSSFYNSRFYNSSFDNSSFYNSSFYNSRFYNSSFDNSSFYNSSFYNSRFYNSSFDSKTIELARKNDQLKMFDSYKADFWMILLIRKHEIAGLKDALIKGMVNGSTYEGACACLVGTFANILHVNYKNVPRLMPDSSRPAERWFYMIKKDDTPENNAIVKLTIEWIEEFEMLLNAH